MRYETEFKKYFEMYGEAYLQQLELETEHKQMAEKALQAALEKAVGKGEASSTKIGRKLTDVAWESCRKNMVALIATTKEKKSGAVPIYMPMLKKLASIYKNIPEDFENLLTLATLSTLIDCVFIDINTISIIATKAVEGIMQEANIEAFYQYEEAKGGDNLSQAKGSKLAKSFEKGIKLRVNESYRAGYATNRMHQEGFKKIDFTKKEKQYFGAKLIEMAIIGSGFFTMSEKDVCGKTISCVEPAEWLVATWQKNTNTLCAYAHNFMPTIIPPKKWDSPYNGGYYGELQHFAKLVRINYAEESVFMEEYRKKLATVDLSYVYEALNAMQETPYRINTTMLDIAEQIVISGGILGGFPQTEPYPTLPKLAEGYTEEELKEHKKKMVGIIKRNQMRLSRALRTTMSLQTAHKFAAYDKIYFPWNIDYRGRCYPINPTMNPQGDDITKALLSFAEPQPCKNPDDWKWLAIHGANLAGKDKIPFASRIKWVEENEEHIINSAQDPLSYTWWDEVAKNDYPFEFLSFCFEWQALKKYLAEHGGSCVGFKSGMPIAFDGTCSGLQHFSAILRDEIGGFAVNLTPTDMVQDIYTIVADKVNKVLTNDAINGMEDGFKTNKKGEYKLDKDGNKIPELGTKTLAQQWFVFSRMKFGTEGITRKVCKRSVMTLAYGSGLYGFKENLISDIIKPFNLNHPEDTPFVNPTAAAGYMAGLIWDSVSSTVVKAVEGMKYLQQVAAAICKEGAVVTWTTPNGLPVQQNYMQTKQEIFKMRINGKTKRFYYREVTGDIDSRGQQQGIAPNFIHSMDATHLQRVVVESYKKGNKNFAMIHDSFGTDVAAAGELFKTIREEFVKLYEDKNHLKDFYESVQYLIDDEADIPEVPEFGNLDIKDVLISDFCFA